VTTYKLPLSSSTSVLQKLTFSMTSKGPNPRQDSPHPHQTITDPTGQYLLVPDLGADLIRIFSIGSSGQLTACTAAQTGSGDGPRHGTFWAPVSGSTSGLMLYTVNELGNSVTSRKVGYPSGGCLTLSKQQTLSTFASGSTPSSSSQYPIKAAEVHVRDNFLYAANRNDQIFGSQQDSIALYNISSSTGLINFVEATNAHAWYPRTFSINKAGTLVAIGGQTSSNVAIVTRDTSTGRLGSLVANVQVGSAGRDGQEDGLSAVTWNESGKRSL
jgi:6-phosphogluconolactonase (cycloisomerase 2 family)